MVQSHDPRKAAYESLDQQEQERLPKFTHGYRQEVVEDDERSGAEILQSYVLPVSCWMMAIVQFLIALVPVRDMWTSNYQGYSHFFMTGSFALSLVVIVVISKGITLKRVKNDV